MLDSEVQTFFTTHSTVLIDELDHSDILLVKRKADPNRPFISSVKQISYDFWDKYSIDVDGHNNFFNLRNSEFFFSKHVIICESPVDKYILEKLVSDKTKNDFSDISFIVVDGVDSISYPYFILKELHIPFSIVVDMDFFFDYVNSNAASSCNSKGFPIYSKTITEKMAKRKVIDDVFNEKINRLEELQNKYEQFFELTKAYNFYPMKYNLETDLVTSREACEKYYELFKLSKDKRSQRYLLSENSGAIKKRKNILRVFSSMDKSSYPKSYKKIKKELNRKIIESIKV